MTGAHRIDRLLLWALGEVWAVSSDTFRTMAAVLARRAAGVLLSPEDIAAAIGRPAGAPFVHPSERAFDDEPLRPVDPARRILSPRSGNGVAVLNLFGFLTPRADGMDVSSGGTGLEQFASVFRRAMATPDVRAIVLNVDSPGGTVAGTQELADEIASARGKGKRIIAVATGMMASAAYWIGSQADEVVGTPSAQVGSIGVMALHEDLSEQLRKAGVQVSVIKAGKFKAEGNPFEPLSDDARAAMQEKVDRTYATFVKAVARGRGVTATEVRNGYGQGRTLDVQAALEAKLIDRASTLDAVVLKLQGRRAEPEAEPALPMRAAALELVVEPQLPATEPVTGPWQDPTPEPALASNPAPEDGADDLPARRARLRMHELDNIARRRG